MEDIKEYMESGVLELYALGDVSAAEKAEVEAMVLKHPAIKAELLEIERSMELYAENNAVEPGENLRDRILNSVLTNFGDDRNFTAAPSHNKDNVIAFRQPGTYNFYKYAFAASVILLIASGIVLANLYSRLQASNTQLATLQTDRQHFANQVNLKDQQLAVLQTDRQHFANQVNLMDEQLAIFRDGTYKFLKLQGTPNHTGSAMTVAWSPVRKKVLIDMGTVKMPENDKAHQYQLWALVGKTPVSLGVFDENTDSTSMKEMQSIASADAFAVTLEPRGGSISPTMAQMVVIGKF